MIPICECRKPTLLRSFRYTSSIITRNLAMSRETVSKNPIESAIREKLISNLKPVHLNVINESHRHKVPRGSETHFRIIIVSDKFENLSPIERHKMINSLIQHELNSGIYSLSVVAKTPKQWSEDKKVKPSPQCLGGKK